MLTEAFRAKTGRTTKLDILGESALFSREAGGFTKTIIGTLVSSAALWLELSSGLEAPVMLSSKVRTESAVLDARAKMGRPWWVPTDDLVD